HAPAKQPPSTNPGAQPKPHKVYDNDNLPTNAPSTVLGDSKSTEDAPMPTAADSKNSSDAAEPSKPPEASAPEQKASQWRLKITDQKKEISLLERELDVLQREFRLR